MDDRKSRMDDVGIGKLLKMWPLIVAIFTAGAWWETAKANAYISQQLQTKLDADDMRLTRVEDAVLYLKDIVQSNRERKRRDE